MTELGIYRQVIAMSRHLWMFSPLCDLAKDLEEDEEEVESKDE